MPIHIGVGGIGVDISIPGLEPSATSGDDTPVAQLHFGAGDSVAFGQADGTTPHFNKSDLANLTVGDLLVVVIHNQSSVSGASITAPAYFTRHGPAPGSPSLGASRESAIYYCPITSQAALDAIDSTVTFTVSNTGRQTCLAVRATGIDLDNPTDAAAAGWTAFSGNQSTANIAAITTTNATTLLVGAAWTANSSGVASPDVSAFMTDKQMVRDQPVGSTTASETLTVGYDGLTAAGSTGTQAFTTTTAWTAGGGILVAFKAGTWSPPVETPVGYDVQYVNDTGTLSTGKTYYVDDAGNLATPGTFKAIHNGYQTVDNMLTHTPFYVAHACGDTDAPALSLYAATKAALWGVGALEISLGRTSDGVWFGVHDATLDAMAGTSGYDFTQHTWAEVSSYQITAGPGGPRPFARLEDFVDAYYGDRVLFIDPKNDTAHQSDLLDYFDSLPGDATQSVVGKFYGHPNTVTWSNNWRARGYQVWAYFYDDTVYSDNIATLAGSYDLLGMDLTASQATWDDIKTYGKPVLGHICYSLSNANTALTKGADGLMTSAVEEVVPEST